MVKGRAIVIDGGNDCLEIVASDFDFSAKRVFRGNDVGFKSPFLCEFGVVVAWEHKGDRKTDIRVWD